MEGIKLSALNDKVNDSLKNHVPSSDDNISLFETEIEQINLDDLTLLRDIAKNDKPPLDPFFDETSTLIYAVPTQIAKDPIVTEMAIRKKRGFFYRYKYSILAAISVIIILVVTTLYFNNEYHLVKRWDNLVYPGVTINGKSYASLTKDDLIASLNKDFSQQMNTKTITIKSGGQTNTILFASLNPKFNTDEVVNEAFNFMKDRGFFSKVNQLLGKNKESLSLKLKYNLDLEELRSFVEKTAEIMKKYPEDASIKIEANSIKIIAESNGQTFKIDELFDILKSKVEEFTYDNIEIDAIVNEDVPKITRDTFSKINGKISSAAMYKYQYNYNIDILSNIQKISNKLNGVLVYSEDEFSFNSIVGDPYTNLEYKLIEKTVNGELADDYFGISESSTVLYNALLGSGIFPTERYKADEPVDYVDFGLEAVVDYGEKDLKFINKFNSPIYIQSNVENGTLTISIYSDISEVQGKTYTPIVKEIDVTNVTKTIINYDDPTLEYGKKVVFQTAIPKKEVMVVLQIADQVGNIDEIELYKQSYEGRPEKVRRGTKVLVEVNSTNVNSTTNSNTKTNNTKTQNTTGVNQNTTSINQNTTSVNQNTTSVN